MNISFMGQLAHRERNLGIRLQNTSMYFALKPRFDNDDGRLSCFLFFAQCLNEFGDFRDAAAVVWELLDKI